MRSRAKAGAAARLAELRALRASGKSRLSTYEVEDAEALYDEVDEEGYKKVVRGRLDQDDFVVEDNGEGYADDGREDWYAEKRPGYASETDSEGDAPLRGKAAKRKREEDQEQQQKLDEGISKYFNANTKTAPQKAKPVATAEDSAFMADLLGEVDVNIPARRVALPMKSVKDPSRRKIRVLSPPLSGSRSRKVERNVRAEPIGSMDTPPQEHSNANDDYDDTPMSDPPLPSSPITRAVERRADATDTDIVKVEADDGNDDDNDDDMLEVAQATVHSGVESIKVNIAGSRPALKPNRADIVPAIGSSPAGAAESVDPSTWNDITSKLNVVSSPPTETVSAGKLQAQDAVEEDGSLRFFWMDYTEMNGSLLLFGKVKNKKNGTFASAFVKVDNILRKLFFLPREHRQKNGRVTSEEVEMGDVYEEVDTLMSKFKVGMHKIKPCSRKYAFEMPNIPREADYLKLLYPYDKPALAMDLEGETFSHVFGTNTSLFEQFVLWKNIMGPCWLRIEDADFTAVNNASWCKLELQTGMPSIISTLGDSDNLEAPPLTLMSIALRTVMNEKENKQEILMASARIYENVSLTDTTPAQQMPCKTLTVMRPVGEALPAGFKMDAEKHAGHIKLERSEAGLLSVFLGHLQRIDPDVLVGHRLEDLGYSLLLSRLRERKTPGWHRIGRLRRSEWPKTMGKGGGSFFAERQLVAGRLLCDLGNDMGKSLMTKCQSWSLAEMCELVLGKGNVRRDIDNETALKTWASSREGLMNYLKHCEADTYFIAAIAMKVQMLPLTKVLTNLAGNSWARTLTGTRAERNEYILLHEFHRNKYICPDKVWNKGKQKQEEEPVEGEENVETKKKDKFKGGLVFEPEKGLYDKVVLVMDFNSLYPSIIQEYNICFTTVERADMTEEDERVPDVPGDQDQGVLPRLIATLVSRRREVKKLMKDKTATTDQLATWDIKQLALKLTANSMYGCLGYVRSRFYARPLATLTTFKGREILQSTKELAETRQLQVIYGDTDSVMINTNVDSIQDALKVGSEFKKAVNERYRLLEIDIDNTFRRLLLHAKKKYAAINMVEIDGKFVDKLEVKGLDMRRREYCALSKDTSSQLLNLLLSGEDPEVVVSKIHDHLRDLAAKMRDYSIPTQKYTIFTQLSKAPQDYPNAKSMPSVQAANRLIARGKTVRAKDVMSFIITAPPMTVTGVSVSTTPETAASNAHPIDEVLRADSGLKPDIDYYLHKQILPPVERLCAPTGMTNVTRLAECLGLDTSKYRVSSANGGNANSGPTLLAPLDSQTPDHVRFAECTPLAFRCLASSCRNTFQLRSLALDSQKGSITHAGLTCPICQTVLRPIAVVAQLEAQIRALLARYYEAWLMCDDPSCGATTRSMSVYGSRCLGPRGLARGCLGRMGWVMGEKAVWNQLSAWERVFDTEKAKKCENLEADDVPGESTHEKVKVLAEINRQRFETYRGVLKGYLDRSGRQWVDMSSLFSFVPR